MNAKKKSVISFKDLQIVFLVEGIEGVKKAIKGRKNPAPLLRKALRELEKVGQPVVPLKDYITKNFGTGNRGRSIPAEGQERVYLAQKLKKPGGGTFLRLPLGPLKTNKGQKVKVRFETNQIIVSNC